MRNLPVVLAAAGLLTLSLAGCSAGSSATTCDRPAQDDELASLVSVDGEVGDEPDVAVPVPFHADGTQIADLATGDGVALVSEWQDIVMGLTIVDGDTGDVLADQGYDGYDAVTSASQWFDAIPGFEQAMRCATDGSRILVAMDYDTFGAGAAETLNLTEGASAVAVIDLRKVYLSAADGADQVTESHGLPTVVRAPGGQPGVIIPDADAPTETVVQVLKKGDGAVPTADDTVRINYTNVAWDTRTVSGTSWGAAPQQVALSGTDDLTQAIVGQPVGSQLLVVLPAEADAASGDSATAHVFVIDVLGIDGQAG